MPKRLLSSQLLVPASDHDVALLIALPKQNTFSIFFRPSPTQEKQEKELLVLAKMAPSLQPERECWFVLDKMELTSFQCSVLDKIWSVLGPLLHSS